MFYQWGRKEPFTFATSSFHNGAHYGKYPVKIYNDKLELIYQEDGGRDNSDKTPVGGIIYPSTPASSMMETVKKPNVFYGLGAVISQVGHSKELWDYYWTSLSRGIDREYSKPLWHNTYLDGYIVLRSKSIYDPCPYGYRTPTNGTYNDFILNTEWTDYSYNGGAIWKSIWIQCLGRMETKAFYHTGAMMNYRTNTPLNNVNAYTLAFSNKSIYLGYYYVQSQGHSIRCIEDATGKAEQTKCMSC